MGRKRKAFRYGEIVEPSKRYTVPVGKIPAERTTKPRLFFTKAGEFIFTFLPLTLLSKYDTILTA